MAHKKNFFVLMSISFIPRRLFIMLCFPQDSEFRRYDFYPGQQLVGCSRSFEDVEWIHRTRELEVALSKPHKSIKVTVEQVQVSNINVLPEIKIALK